MNSKTPKNTAPLTDKAIETKTEEMMVVPQPEAKALPPEGRLAEVRAEQAALRAEIFKHDAESEKHATIFARLIVLAEAEVQAREEMTSDMIGDSRLQRIARGTQG